MTDIQEAQVTLEATSRAGNPAEVQNPVWTSSDEAVLTVEPSADGLTARFVTTGKLGLVQVSVTADADLGDGVTELHGMVDIEITPSEPVVINLSPGVPTDRAA